MLKSTFLSFLISTILFSGSMNPKLTDSAIEDPNTSTAKTETFIKNKGNSVQIPQTEIEISLPSNYKISKNSEENRRGSFASYDISNENYLLPDFQEIQFFNEKSIKQFTSDCHNKPCFFGDYPDITRYNEQKIAFNTEKNQKDYKLNKIGNRNYFVRNINCSGDSCIIREYTTFINDTKIDIWITMQAKSQETQADELIKELEIY